MKIVPQVVRCALGQHEPDRRKVEWDAQHFAGKCKGCGVDIYRKASKQWRAVGRK